MIVRAFLCAAVLFFPWAESFAVSIADGLHLDNFRTFDTPRTFDGPGNVYRVERDGVPVPVEKLDVRVENVGTEEFAWYSREVSWGIDLLVSLLKIAKPIATIGADAEIGVDNQYVVRLGTGHRFRTYDNEVKEALKRAKFEYLPNSKYYVIREAIAVDSIDIGASPRAHAGAQANATLKKLASVAAEATWSDSSRTVLRRSFDTPHYVFFKANRISPPGVGMSSTGNPRLYPMNSSDVLIWEKDVPIPEAGK